MNLSLRYTKIEKKMFKKVMGSLTVTLCNNFYLFPERKFPKLLMPQGKMEKFSFSFQTWLLRLDNEIYKMLLFLRQSG